ARVRGGDAGVGSRVARGPVHAGRTARPAVRGAHAPGAPRHGRGAGGGADDETRVTSDVEELTALSSVLEQLKATQGERRRRRFRRPTATSSRRRHLPTWRPSGPTTRPSSHRSGATGPAPPR